MFIEFYSILDHLEINQIAFLKQIDSGFRIW
jgi:hypothetical protein